MLALVAALHIFCSTWTGRQPHWLALLSRPWLPWAASAARTGAASARRETAAFANECAMRACTSVVSSVAVDRVLSTSANCAGRRRRRRVPPHQRPGEDVVNQCYLIINLDFSFRRRVVARAVGCGIRRRPLLPSDISRLPSNTQPRARDTANDVSPKPAAQVDVQKTSEALVEPQPYR